MHVIWKRPDGFHGADPSDFTVVSVSGDARIWLHKKEHTWFPFQVAGGWQESKATQRLNSLVNLVLESDDKWYTCLERMFDDTMGDDAGPFVDELASWISDLKGHAKGDTWELEIMKKVLSKVEERLKASRNGFVQKTKSAD